VKATIARIARTLSKVYVDKGIEWEIEISEALGFRGDEGDFMEILGNLMDNAWKYGRSRVRISGWGGLTGLELHVEDDGKGVPDARLSEVLERGRRVDQQQPGQGIGLTVANDIAQAYGGALHIGRSTLGGADVSLSLPTQGVPGETDADG
jgi:two-component system sensor histidine kinase PhoQ